MPRCPARSDLLADGWVDRSWDIALHEVRALLTSIDATGALPPHRERLSGLTRGLDFWGVTKGDVVWKQ